MWPKRVIFTSGNLINFHICLSDIGNIVCLEYCLQVQNNIIYVNKCSLFLDNARFVARFLMDGSFNFYFNWYTCNNKIMDEDLF